MWTQPKEGHMTAGQLITSRLLDRFVHPLQLTVRQLDLGAAHPANNVVMILTRRLVNQLPTAKLPGQRKTLIDQKIQGAIDGRLHQAGNRATSLFIYFARGQVSSGM